MSLPSGYTEVEYIQSSGTQYINTGIVYNSSNEMKFTCEIEPTAYSSATYSSGLFGWDGGGLLRAYSDTIFSCTGNSLGTYVTVGNTLSKTSITMTIAAGTQTNTTYSIINNGVTYSMTRTHSLLSSISRGFPLFGITNATQYFGQAKMYSASIEENSETVRNFVPCIRNSDSAVGMYDTVTSTFFGNSGTGVFTAGPAVSETPKIYIGDNDTAAQVTKIYIGVNGVAKKVAHAYIGVNGVAKKIF